MQIAPMTTVPRGGPRTDSSLASAAAPFKPTTPPGRPQDGEARQLRVVISISQAPTFASIGATLQKSASLSCKYGCFIKDVPSLALHKRAATGLLLPLIGASNCSTTHFERPSPPVNAPKAPVDDPVPYMTPTLCHRHNEQHMLLPDLVGSDTT